MNRLAYLQDYNVYYRNELTNRLCRYCCEPMTYETAQEFALKFNSRYPGKAFPNNKGYYPYSKAWVDIH